MTNTNAVENRMRWNLNTIILGVSLAVMIGGWGWAWGDTQFTLSNNTEKVSGIDKRVTSLETSTRQLDNHELRISSLERQSGNTASALRSLENTLNELSSDMKVTREILQRLENRQLKDGDQRR